MSVAFTAPDANTIGLMSATLQPKYGSNGKVFRQVRVVTTTLTTNTPYRIGYDEYGPFAVALADDADTYRVGVATEAAKVGTLTWLQTGGYVAAMITPSLSISVGHGLGIRGGAITDEGADFDDLHSAVFAICTTASTSSATQAVLLIDEPITAST